MPRLSSATDTWHPSNSAVYANDVDSSVVLATPVRSGIFRHRPDISCAIVQAAQVTVSMYAKEPLTYIKRLNAVVKHLRKTASFTVKYPKLDFNSLTLKVYTDESYANNFDGSS
jgi:hypothetical protein